MSRQQRKNTGQWQVVIVAAVMGSILFAEGCSKLNLKRRSSKGDRSIDNEIHALPIVPDVDFVSTIDLGEGRRLYISERDLLYAEGDRYYPIVVRGYPKYVGRSPGGDAVAFIEPAEFEMDANLYVFDLPARTLRRVTEVEDGSSTVCVKSARWFDDSTLYYLQGYRYGTVSRGGDLWRVDLNTMTHTPIVSVMGSEYAYSEIVDFEFVPGSKMIRYVVSRYDEFGAETRKAYYRTLDGKPVR